MTEVVARFDQVSKTYGAVTALDRIDLEVHGGTFVGLLGGNGAGKSTLLSILAGLRRPSGGRVELFGGSPLSARNRRLLGMTPQQTGLPGPVRVGELLDLAARHYESPAPQGEILERFGLSGFEKRQSGGLSGGQQRRLAVALAFIGRPKLVILDEPTTGLDVDARNMLWEGIRQHSAEGGTVLLTSHYMEEVEALAQRVVVLKSGTVVADGDTDTIKSVVSLHTVRFTSSRAPSLDNVHSHERDGDVNIMRTRHPDLLVHQLVSQNVEYSDLDIRRPSLEDAFLAIDKSSQTAA